MYKSNHKKHSSKSQNPESSTSKSIFYKTHLKTAEKKIAKLKWFLDTTAFTLVYGLF